VQSGRAYFIMSDSSQSYSIHEPEFWQLDRQDRDETIALYVQTAPEFVSADRAFEAAIMAWQDVGRLALVVEKLALERAPQPSSPARPRGRPKQPPTVRANSERGYLTVMGKRMTYEEAQQLGSLIFQALSGEGAQNE
jgi:hypothetical protein